VQLIREAGGHLLSVVNSILEVSKIESGSYEICPEPFPFREAVELSLSMTRQQAEAKSIALSSDVPDTLGEVCYDRRAMQQILINLLANAVKFTPRGGSVSVAARRKDGRFELEVSDTGIGMSREDLQRIGQPFMQVQNDYTRQFEGTGLGLALVKGLVALQGGTMAIESAPGAGTCVRISLPAAVPEASGDSSAPEQKPASIAERHGMRNETLRKSA
jgi:cell cycle sensor histidine kinase DivJ